MNELIDQLQKKGAEIVLYEDDRVVETEFLKNIIEAHFDCYYSQSAKTCQVEN